MMITTVEISNYPLNADYEPPILDFINRLKEVEGLKIQVNATSTHIGGEYNLVMETLQQEIRTSFERYGKMIFVMKVLNGDLL
jgi:uncharacterized protein YqgV (UPF0045/DUF77 family)